MNTPRVVITETLDTLCAQWLEKRAELIWCPLEDESRLRTALADAEGLIVRTYTQVNDALLDLAPKLKVVGRAGVGLDNIDLEACRRRGVRVVYTPDANTQAVVDYVLGLMLDVLRPWTAMPAGITPEAFHALRKSEVGLQLDQLTLGILGLGRIGKKLARVASTLGMKVLACDLLPEASLRAAVDTPFDYVDQATLFRESHIVTVHVDGRPENRHLLNRRSLADLREDSVLINAARGMLVDAQALADWARAHPQARVLLDVHEPEPPTADYPLWNISNVTLLPHLASRTPTALENMSWVVRDIWRVLEGEQPQDAAV